MKNYLLFDDRGLTVIGLLDEAGRLKAAPVADMHRALVYGLACLNTGKDERTIMKHIAAITPQEGA